MKYLADVLVMAVTGGKPFVVEDKEAGIQRHDAHIGELVKITLNAYVPRTGKVLETQGDIRSLNRVLDILDGAPQEHVNGTRYWRFEDEDWKVLRRVVEWTVPVLPYFRLLDEIMRTLDGALSKLPALPDPVIKD